MFCDAMFALYLLFLPPLLSLDTETDAAATQYDYGVDDPSSAELPGKKEGHRRCSRSQGNWQRSQDLPENIGGGTQ